MYQLNDSNQASQLPPYALSVEERINILANLILDRIQATHKEAQETVEKDEENAE